MKGLSFRKTADAIAAFVSQHGDAPRRAVLCTYDLHPARFEAVVLPQLTRRSRWFRTLVMADQAQLQKVGVVTQRSAGAAYELAPVRLRGSGVFHPKLIVLQAGDRMLIGIGSANLTPGGLGGNLELMLFASNDTVDGEALAASAVKYLYDLSQARSVVCPVSAKRFLERLCASTRRRDNGPIAHSLDRPLIKALADGRPNKVVSAAVVSPWHSSTASPLGVEPAVLDKLTTALGARPTVFTEGQSGKGPDLGRALSVRILKSSPAGAGDELDPTDGNDDVSQGPKRPASLHAKAYLAAYRRGATLWFGSANCTVPALLRTASNGGNVELLLRVDLGKAELTRFESDLEQMFEKPRGVLTVNGRQRIPLPRGHVLAGYASSWHTKARMRLDLVEFPSRHLTLSVSRTGKPRDAISLNVSGSENFVNLGSTLVEELLRDHKVPSVLWEHVGGTSIPFPVSVACVTDSEDPEEQLDDLFDELKGRMPAPFRSRRRRRDEDSGEDTPSDEDERDTELALLTKTEHQGTLDRIAVRVELLRRRLALAKWSSAEAFAHYRSAIEKLAIDSSLKVILTKHLGNARRQR